MTETLFEELEDIGITVPEKTFFTFLTMLHLILSVTLKTTTLTTRTN